MLKDPAVIESVPTLQSNPVGQSTGISSSMAPRGLGAVQQPWQCPSTASKAGKESLACDENWCVDVFQDVFLDGFSSFLDHRLEAVGSHLPVAAGHKGHPRRGKTRTVVGVRAH